MRFAAISASEFNGITTVGPFSNSARENEKLFVWDLRVPQGQCRKLAVLAIAAVAIDDDFLGGLAHRKYGPHVILWMIIVELIGPGYVTALIMFVITSIYEDKCALLVKGIMEQFYHLFSIHNLKAFFFESRNYGIWGRIGAGRDGSRSVCFGSRDRKRFTVEIILCQSESTRGKSVRSECDDCTDRSDQKRFE